MASRTLVLALALALVASLVACKKDIKPSGEDSKLAMEVFAVIEQMRVAYVDKDDPALEALSTEGGYDAINKQLGGFNSVELEFSPRWVTIEGDSVVVNVAWKGVWTVKDEKRKGRGMAVMVLDGTTYKLRKLHRSSPFGVPE